MNEKHKRSMIIHFNDGSKKLLEFPAPVPDSDANLAARLKEALDARHLVLEADGAARHGHAHRAAGQIPHL